MLPGPIRTFFLFDGDRIADFTKPGRDRDDKISKAVNDVLHIEALSRAVDHVSRIAGERRRTLERADAPGVERTSSELRMEESTLANRRERLKQIAHELEQRNERRSAIDSELLAINAVAKQALSRRNYEADRQGKISRGVELRRKLARETIAATPALVVDRLRDASEILARYKSRDEIPARIADYFVRDLLQHGDCICGRRLDDDSAARSHLEEILKNLIPNSLQDIANQLAGRLRPLISEHDPRLNDVVKTLSEIEENGKDISRLDHELERLGKDIDASALDKAQVLNRERMIISRQTEELHADRARAERDADVGAKKLRLLEDRLKGETAKQAGQESLRLTWILARDCADDLQRAKGLLEERLRESLGIEATAILKNLASDEKKYFFSEIRVDSGFLLRVLDNEGRDVRSQLSMGETQVSSLAFMLAMTRLGGQQAPLAIDTPLGRLDESVRLNAAMWLPKLTPQLVLLVTDSEYTAEVAERLSSRVGSRFVQTEYHEFYRILANDEGEARVKTFDTMKDVFMLAFAFGVVKRHRTALGPSREVFDDRVLRDTDKDLIKAVVLADDEGALHSLADEDALLQVAQEYANTGIRVLRQEYLSATPAESMASALLDLVPH